MKGAPNISSCSCRCGALRMPAIGHSWLAPGAGLEDSCGGGKIHIVCYHSLHAARRPGEGRKKKRWGRSTTHKPHAWPSIHTIANTIPVQSVLAEVAPHIDLDASRARKPTRSEGDPCMARAPVPT